MSFELFAQARTDLGKGASRRLRREAKVPGVVYGVGEPQSITLEHKGLWKAQESEAFYSSLLNLNIDGKTTSVVIQDIQRHPAKDLVMHVDFLALDPKVAISVNVPLHFSNKEICHGVKMQGGSVQVLAQVVKIRCLPADLPAFINFDLAKIKAGEIIHISDLQLPEGVTSVDLVRGEDHDLPIVQVNASRGK
jgi:large subunit ribosomal protein L25